MSFPLLQEYIEKLDDEREVTLFLLAFLFKVMQTKSVKAWIRLADRFSRLTVTNSTAIAVIGRKERGMPEYGWPAPNSS